MLSGHCQLFTILLVFTYFFSTIANIIASPFNGLLAEKLEGQITGINPPDTGLLGITKRYSAYFKTRNHQGCLLFAKSHCLLLLLYFVPVVGQTVAPILLVYIWRLDDGNPI